MTTKEYIESIMPTMERMVQECTCAIEDRLCEHCIFVNETNDLCKRITQILLKEIEEGRLIVASELLSVEEIRGMVSEYTGFDSVIDRLAIDLHNRLTKRSER